jgi:hypothetical protein
VVLEAIPLPLQPIPLRTRSRCARSARSNCSRRRATSCSHSSRLRLSGAGPSAGTPLLCQNPRSSTGAKSSGDRRYVAEPAKQRQVTKLQSRAAIRTDGETLDTFRTLLTQARPDHAADLRAANSSGPVVLNEVIRYPVVRVKPTRMKGSTTAAQRGCEAQEIERLQGKNKRFRQREQVDASRVGGNPADRRDIPVGRQPGVG